MIDIVKVILCCAYVFQNYLFLFQTVKLCIKEILMMKTSKLDQSSGGSYLIRNLTRINYELIHNF